MFEEKQEKQVDKKMKVNEFGERQLISIIEDILGALGNSLIPGQDDAVAIPFVELTASNILINTDMLVSTTDIPPQMTYFQAGRKSVVMSASDVFVKGALPKWAIVSLGIPNDMDVEGENGFKGLIQGMKNGFDSYDIQYLGGDLNESKELIISCTIIGIISMSDSIITRSKAEEGDIIACTGEFGQTGCGLRILMHEVKTSDITIAQKERFIESVLNPHTATDEARILTKNRAVHASADSSDGLLKTISEICKASDVGARIYWYDIPVSDGVIEFAKANQLDERKLALGAGEEFAHVFCIPENRFEEMKTLFEVKGKQLSSIGEIVSHPKNILLVQHDGSEIELNGQRIGYDHFSDRNAEIELEARTVIKQHNSEQVKVEEGATSVSPEADDQTQPADSPEDQAGADSGMNDKHAAVKEQFVDEKIGEKSEQIADLSLLNHDMPGYRQYSGACGLTSLLMALKPESRGFDTILNVIWSKIRSIFGKNSDLDDSHNWQRVLEYILFRIAEDEKLHYHFAELFDDDFRNVILPVLKHRISEQKPRGLKSAVFDKWIMRRVNVWKMDFELELIAYLFGCRFKKWPQTKDGTGAIYFTAEELMDLSDHFQRKIKFIRDALKDGDPVLCCASIHWIAIKDITPINDSSDNYLVRYNDPASGTEHRRLLDGFVSSERFYVFKYDEKLFSKLEDELRSL
mgnify:CR=1 FL=1